MNKDTSQVVINHSLHSNMNAENHAQTHLSSISEQEQQDQNAEMDALESRLFALAGSRN